MGKWDSDYGMRPQDVDVTYWGSDTKGHDFKFFGDTTGKYVSWVAADDTLYVVGTLALTGTFNTGNIALTDNETITFGTGSDVNEKFDGTDMLYTKAAASASYKYDADTTDTTANVMEFDVGVNSADCNVININLDVGTALSAAEIVKGLYMDINGKAANADTSGIMGIDLLLTATSTDRADITGTKIKIDGTMDGADTIKGILVDLDTTLSTATLYGLHIDGSGITHTNATLYGIYNDVSAAVSAGTSIAEFIKLSAAATGISIDGGTNDSTAGNAITIDWDVNSSNSKMINATIDIGTALSAAEIVQGIYFDINEIAANANTSEIHGVDLLMTGVSTAASDLVGYKVLFDGTKDTADSTKGLFVDGNLTINNGSETLYGAHFDFSGTTHTDGTLYGTYTSIPTAASGSAYGHYILCNNNTTGIYINSDTTDRTTGYCISTDLGVNDGNCGIMYGTLDMGTAFTTAKSARGILFDINESAAGTDGSALYGVDLLMTGVSTGRADLIGYKINIDGTKDGGDLTKGFFADLDCTINNGSESLYGQHIDGSGVTHTDGTFYGQYIDLPTAASGTSTASYIKCGATTTGIYINSGSNDRTSGYCINMDLDVNNASCGGIYGTIDWGTVSAGTTKTIRGLFYDMNDLTSGLNGSAMIGAHMLMTGVTGGNSDLQAYKAEFDGSRNQGDTVTGLYVDNNQTINNASELFYGTRILCDGVTHTSGKVYAHYVDISQAVTAGDNFGLHETLGLYGVGLYMTGTAGKSTDSMQITANAGKANIDVEIDNADRWEVFDDFNYQTIADTYTPWILTSGGDAQALDPTISTAERGVINLVTGDVDGAVANDGSQIICSVPVQADSGGLIAETRLYIDTAITAISVWFGFTDANTLEEPVTNAADSLSFVANDAAVFHFDDGATTKEWFAAAVDGTTADTGNGATGSAPVAGTYQKLRIEVSSDGATIKFYVNDTLVKTLSGAAGVSPDVNLYATVGANATTTTSKTVVVDYLKVGHNR